MQISSKPVVQACDNFEILMHTSKGEQKNFKFLFIQFTCWLRKWTRPEEQWVRGSVGIVDLRNSG